LSALLGRHAGITDRENEERHSRVSPPYQEHGCVDGGTAPCILKFGTRWREIISFSIRSLFTTEEKISSNSEGPKMAPEPL